MLSKKLGRGVKSIVLKLPSAQVVILWFSNEKHGYAASKIPSS